jgi:hypothetical protein
MSIIPLKRFGINLSGRPLGMSSLTVILQDYQAPYTLDFKEVFSIGSSFADEVVAKLAELNGGEIQILNSSTVINKCLKDVAKEKGFKLTFEKISHNDECL